MDTKAYSSFFHEVADNLIDADIHLMTIGSDEEYAFKKAINHCFHGCTHVLCTRHLKQNANRYMEDEAGIPVKDRQVILNKIFGKEGLTETTDIDVYNTRVMNIRSIIDDNDNAPNGKIFRLYFDNKLLSLLKAHVIEPAKRGID